jgi:hypothetical protein
MWYLRSFVIFQVMIAIAVYQPITTPLGARVDDEDQHGGNDTLQSLRALSQDR